MSFSDIVKRFGKVTADNSPLILTAIGVTGTITTAVLAGRGAFKAAEVLQKETKFLEAKNHTRRINRVKKNLEPEVYIDTLDTREKIELTWKFYIPAVVTGALTVSCVIGANRIGMRRAAGLAAAYSLSEKAFTEYREKIVEKLGEDKEREARDEIAQAQLDRNPVTSSQVFVASRGNQLCLEAFTGRYFESDMETLKRAQNAVNYQINQHYSASLSDFYHEIGLPTTDMSDQVGWNSDRLLEIYISGGIADDQRPCLVLTYQVEPVRMYDRIH